MKNNLQGIHSRVDEAENSISDLAHKEAENIQTAKRKKESKT